jgi:uncharacterized protein YbcV (DUF1398 family)
LGGRKQSAFANLLPVKGVGWGDEAFAVTSVGDRSVVVEQLRLHGESSYGEMSWALAATGVEKWSFDTQRLTSTYYDSAGLVLLSEAVG